MPELPRLKDRAPIYGMNSRDDQKDLREGEVVSLINAYPGNPPIPRKGCKHNRILNTDDYDYASEAIAYVTTSDNKYAVVWVKDGTDYLLLKINLTTYLRTILGTATDLTNPAFRFIHIFNFLYTVCDEDMTWEDSVQSTRHKVIEIGDVDGTYADDVVREMCINVSAEVLSVEKITGTTFGAGYVSYAFTFIRHSVAAAFDSGIPQQLTTYYPGISEGLEALANRLTVGDSSAFGVQLNLLYAQTELDYDYALEQGATHLRIHRTRLLTTEELAEAATHYFCMDVPIPSSLPAKSIEDIELDSNDARVTTSAVHGFSSGNALLGMMNDTDLNGVHAITVESTKIFKLNGSSDQSYDDFAGTSYASQDYVGVDSVDLSNTNVRVTTSTAHGWSTDDTVMITGVTNGDGLVAGTKYKYMYQKVNTVYDEFGNATQTFEWVAWWRTLGAYSGINGATYTVTVIDTTTIELQATPSADYLIPYLNNSEYPIYTDEDKIPAMSGGYAASTLKAIASMSTPENKVVIETTTNHNLVADYYVRLSDIVGSTELNDETYQVLAVLSDTRARLDVSTSGISEYVSGGTVIPSIQPLVYEDTVTDATLAGETAQLLMTGYSVGPRGGFCEYAKTRFWLFGLVSTEKGRAYYSEVPGGAGATPIDAAHTYPHKFLGLFHHDYFIDFSVKKGYLPTGVKRLSDDLFFFFEGEIYALFGSDPTLASPTLISEDIGCAFPDTLIVGELPKYGGQCLLYLSNLGPAITKQGGETFLFTDFKIAELWPDVNRELYDDLLDEREHIVHHCTAEYWDNTWWISYETDSGEKKVWAYYFNPEIKFDPKAPHGSFEVDLAEV